MGGGSYTERMRIDTNGNIGIGITNPSEKLEVEGSIGVKRIGIAATSTIDMQGNFNFDANSGYSHVFKQAGSEVARILPSGNVGIGNNNPTAGKLVVFANSGYAFRTENTLGFTFRIEAASGNIYTTGDTYVQDGNKIRLGDNNDLQIYHAGGTTGSYIDNYTGSVILTNSADDKDIIFKADRGDGNAGTYFYLDGSLTNNSSILGATRFPDKSKILMGTGGDLEIYHDGSNSYLVNKTGNLEITNNTDNGNILFRSDNGGGGTATYLTIDGLYEVVLFNRNASFGNNVKATFGNADLQIYHNGTYSYIDQPSGLLRISAPAFEIVNAAKSGYIARFFEAGNGNENVELYYAGSKQFETTSTGITVAGSIKIADDTDTASASKVGTMRYRTGTEYVEVDGVDLVTNGDFATATDWTTGADWAIAGGTANAASATSNPIYQTVSGFTAGNKYRVRFEVTAVTNGYIRVYAYVGASGSFSNVFNSTDLETGIYEGVFEFGGTNKILRFYGSTGSAGGFAGSIDNVSVIEVTEEDASYADMCMQTAASTYEWVNIVRNSY
jgi:hypothetical protein